MFSPSGLFISGCVKTAIHCICLVRFSLTMILLDQGVVKVVLHQRFLPFCLPLLHMVCEFVKDKHLQ